MSELIIAGFDDAHTAHLVSAVFARLQEEILTEGPRVMELDGFETFCPEIPRPPETRK